MTDIVSDGQPFETPLSAANEDYARISPSFGRAFGAMYGEGSPTLALSRASERGQYAGSSWLDQWVSGAGTAELGEAGIPVDLTPKQSPMLSAADANKRYAPPGTTITDQPMPEAIAQLVGKEKAAEQQRENVLARFSAAHSWPVNLGMGAAAFILDPLNAGTTLIPGVGEEAITARLGTGLIARTAGRAVAGAATGAVAQAPLSTLHYGLGREEASDYDLRAAFRDMAFSAAGGAVLHAGLGAAGDLFRPAGSAAAGASDQMLGLVRGLERSGDEAVSPKGAVGRYQIEPGTARQYGFDPARLTDPAYNEQVARAVLADLNKRYAGDTQAVLVAYNAGPGRADEWLKAGRDNSVLPLETRNYLAHAAQLGRGVADIQAAPAMVRADGMRSAVSQITDGRPVDVLPVIDESGIRSAGDEARLRREDAALAEQQTQLPAGDTAAADRLARLKVVESGLADETLSPDARSALSTRRDELLSDTTPEALQAAAQPIEDARQLGNQRANIAARLAEIASQRTGQAADAILRAQPFDPAALARVQQRLYENGFAPGVPQHEFDAAREQIYGGAPKPARRASKHERRRRRSRRRHMLRRSIASSPHSRRHIPTRSERPRVHAGRNSGI